MKDKSVKFRWFFLGLGFIYLLSSFFLLPLRVDLRQLSPHLGGFAEAVALLAFSLLLNSLGLWILLSPWRKFFSLGNCILATLAGYFWGQLTGWPLGLGAAFIILYEGSGAPVENLLAGLLTNQFLQFALTLGLAGLGANFFSSTIPQIIIIPVLGSLILASLAFFLFLEVPGGTLLRKFFAGDGSAEPARKTRAAFDRYYNAVRTLLLPALPALVLAILAVLVQGVGYGLLANSLGGTPDWTRLVAATTLVKCTHFLPNFPGGVGVREAFLVKLLSPFWTAGPSLIYGFCLTATIPLLSALGFAAFAAKKIHWEQWLWPERKTRTSEEKLATPVERLAAILMDGLFWVTPASLFAVVGEAFVSAAPLVSSGLFALTLVWTVGFGLFQAVKLHNFGWTVGKKIMGIRIVSVTTGKNGGFTQNVILRYLFPAVLIPFSSLLTLFIDGLFIVRKDRRCLHDLVAGTEVIKIKA